MKPFFWIDVTDKKNKDYNTTKFINYQVPMVIQQNLYDANSTIEDLSKKAQIPFFWRFLDFILTVGMIILLMCAGVIVGYLGLLGFLLIIPAAVLYKFFDSFIKKKRDKRVEEIINSREFDSAVSQKASAVTTAVKTLDVPSHARNVDILSNKYTFVNGAYNLKLKPHIVTVHNNLKKIIYVENSNLYIVQYPYRFCIPNFQPMAIYRIKEKVGFIQWNKSEGYDSDKYKPYGITNNGDAYFCKWYGVLRFNTNGEIWDIYFPPYELPFWEGLTGLKSE